METGTVKWFNETKGYGFIQPDNGDKDVFVHVSAVQRSGLMGLREGHKVSYELQTDQRNGKTSAVNLQAARARWRKARACALKTLQGRSPERPFCSPDGFRTSRAAGAVPSPTEGSLNGERGTDAVRGARARGPARHAFQGSARLRARDHRLHGRQDEEEPHQDARRRSRHRRDVALRPREGPPRVPPQGRARLDGPAPEPSAVPPPLRRFGATLPCPHP